MVITSHHYHGAPPALALGILLLCVQTLNAEKPTYRSVIEEAFRNMKEVNVTAILDSLQTGYDKRIRPNYGGSHVDVGITMHILSISSLSEVQMDFTMDCYFRQHWRDPRLDFSQYKGLEKLQVSTDYTNKIWVPDTFFPNEKRAYYHTATTPNEMLRIQPDGTVLRSIRLTITASCPMNLQYFPMDRQLCIIEIESFGYSMDHIRFSWHAGDKSIAIEQAVSLPQFRVLGYSRKTIVASTSTGNYSRLLCEIMFVRSMGYYLIQIYIPSSLIVIISWVSFWLNRAATVARVSLGVTTVLTMTTLISSTNAALPKISYIKSIDVYLGTCFVMVFSSLIEYAAVGYLGKRIQIRKNRFMVLQKLAEQRIAASLEMSHPPPNEHPDHNMKQQTLRGKARSTQELSHPYKMKPDTEVRYKVHDPKAHSKGGTLENTTVVGRPPVEEAPPKDNKELDTMCGCCPASIDKYSRIVFPVCFVCFNLMYWIIYLHISDDPAEDLILHNAGS